MKQKTAFVKWQEKNKFTILHDFSIALSIQVYLLTATEESIITVNVGYPE